MNKYTYQQVYDSSLEYFHGDELAAKVFVDKYSLKDNDENFYEKDPAGMHNRLASEFARIESKKFKDPLSFEDIYGLFDHFKYIIPQGSPMFGIGNDHQIVSLSNCFVLETPLDSYSSILKTDEQLISISKRRGGTGINLSNLRPEGTPTNNAARTSTGVPTWMHRYSNSIREVGQGGRRGALMLVLDVRHIDIEKFITIKQDRTQVTGANISVLINQDFLDKIAKNENFQLQWPVNSKSPKIVKTIKAGDLWNLLIKAARDHAEPGILMWDNILKGPADCYEKYRSEATNPCAELPLPSFDSCRLICLNLYSYVINPFTEKAKFDFALFGKHAEIAQRLMDDLVDLESEKIAKILIKIHKDPEPEMIKRDEIHLWERIKKMNDEGRRTGLGITALGDCLAALGFKYGTPEATAKAAKIYRQLKLSAYKSSVDMAEELGAFVGFDQKQEEDNEFLLRIKDEDKTLYDRMKKFGRRNVALLTTAPTGTVSILTQTSSGIEPVFQLGYTRRKKVNHNDANAQVDFVDKSGDKWQEFTIFHPKVKDWMMVTGLKDLKKSPWHGCLANDIDWINRVKMQAEVQKHVCHAISSTINLPNSVSEEVVSKIYTTAFQLGCKGMTVYRDGCRSGVLVNKEPDFPKRPKDLSGHMHHFTLDGHKYYVVVGLDNESSAYEVFTGINDRKKDEIPKTIKTGIIHKVSRGQYVFRSEEEEFFLNNGHNDSSADALSRLISCALRHKTPIIYIIEQLLKTDGPMFTFAKILARTLKQYIPDNSKSTEDCPECGTKLIFSDGCSKCPSCGASKCS